MTMLVTLEAAKAQIVVDHSFDDDHITRDIEAASAAVLEYIGDTQYMFLDTGGEILDLDTSTEQKAFRALHLAQKATKLLLADWYKNRTPQSEDPFFAAQVGYGYLPRAVTALLYSLHTPTIA
jgi:Phage QLRG family, putative DNA packaging.